MAAAAAAAVVAAVVAVAAVAVAAEAVAPIPLTGRWDPEAVRLQVSPSKTSHPSSRGPSARVVGPSPRRRTASRCLPQMVATQEQQQSCR